MNSAYYLLGVNPEPWAIGDVSAGRRGGRISGTISPNPNLVAFQSAVRGELEGVDILPKGKYKLTFRFWRQQARYLDAADRVRKRNEADATNMQKALEDALQGVLFDNDRDVQDIRSVIMEQGPNVVPCILIEASLADNDELDITNLPAQIQIGLKHLRNRPRMPQHKSDKWAEGDELF